MAHITLRLPDTVSSEPELEMNAEHYQDIPAQLKRIDRGTYENLYMERAGKTTLKPFASVFINNKLYFECAERLNDGDVVEITIAIAGG
ncbi:MULTISPECIES: MoaD/ThiS family protein [Pseudomonas]|jgi:hypothetical protein|uniref:MoaD/ThiS family protein n=1 Tax=Pseudomonas TaxID=286 RepID=UPI00081267EF|nr:MULTISPECIES: MoaD/ThiS family protein [Pseudomonas]RZI18354.1 hypothetical protein EUX53_24725 [Pseudomonas orientalis]CRM33333.1 hypothetical protein [Pseudomonas sp. 28 E 9]